MNYTELYTVQITYADAHCVARHTKTARRPFVEFCKVIDKAGFNFGIGDEVIHIPGHRVISIRQVRIVSAGAYDTLKEDIAFFADNKTGE